LADQLLLLAIEEHGTLAAAGELLD